MIRLKNLAKLTLIFTTSCRMMGNTVQNDELKSRLTPLQYQVTQNHSTEPPFKNEFYYNKKEGEYNCVVCGELIFLSDSKFDSGSGWPAFSEPSSKTSVESTIDKTHGMVREEVHCAKCKAHLGHVFNDGPKANGLRYCINSASMEFKEKK